MLCVDSSRLCMTGLSLCDLCLCYWIFGSQFSNTYLLTYLLTISYGLRSYKWKSVEGFRKVWVTLSVTFRRHEASSTNHCWCQKVRVIALSRGIKISAVHCLFLSQNMRVTDRRTDGQKYDSKVRASIAMSRCKNCTKYC